LHISKWDSQINGSAYIKIIESQAEKVRAEQYCITHHDPHLSSSILKYVYVAKKHTLPYPQVRLYEIACLACQQAKC